jgi:outer membrane usher protein
MQWTPQQTYIGRDIMALMSRLTMGQVSTTGRVFDSVNFKGIMLSSIDEMLADSQRSYGPVIKGIALSQATVEVRQGGTLIYQQDVPPGAFELTDVVPGRSSGDLEVTVRESSGEVRTFIQPYATQPKMVREGQLRYSLSAGTYDDANKRAGNNLFTQGEALYGINNRATLFGGALLSNNYQSVASGVGLNLGGLGGLSLELDASKKRADGRNEGGSGLAAKVNYAKYLEVTGTSLTASLTESLDQKYATYQDYQTRNVADADLTQPTNIRRQWQLGINQPLGFMGALSLNYYSQDSWDAYFRSKTLNVSYSKSWAGVNANLSLSQSDITNGTRIKDNVVALNVTVPFSTLWGAPGQARINHNYIQGNEGPAQNQTSVSGTLLRDNNLNYSLSRTWSGDQTGEAVRAQYYGGSGSVNAGYSQNSTGSRQMSLGASGSVVAHPGGVTLGQKISNDDAFAIVSAPGAGGVSVTTKSGVKTDWRGYAIVPSLSAYRGNNISLDSTTADDDTTLNATQIRAVPGFGTAVDASFATAIGRKAWVKVLHRNEPLPFGTELNGTQDASGIVDEKGFAWLTGLTDGERLNAVVDGGYCSIKVSFAHLKLKNDLYTGTFNCE